MRKDFRSFSTGSTLEIFKYLNPQIVPPVKIVQYDISYRALFRVLAVAALVAAVIFLSDIVLAIVFAVVIASGIEPAVQWFGRYRLPRIGAVLLIYLVAAAVLAGVIYLIIPVLVDEFNVFLETYPLYQRQFLKELREFRNVPFYSFFSETVTDVILNPPFELGRLTTSTFGFLFSLFGGVVSGIILIVVSFYLASQERGIEYFIRLVVPLKHEEYAIDLFKRAQAKIGHWLRAQVLLGLLVGALVYIGLTLLGIRYALTLGVLAAIFELVPIIGPILAAVPAVLLALLSSPLLALGVALMYVVIQQVESHLVVPLVMRRTVGLNPLVVIISLLVGAKTAGILGIFLAVPVAAVLVELIADRDRRRREALEAGAPQA